MSTHESEQDRAQTTSSDQSSEKTVLQKRSSYAVASMMFGIMAIIFLLFTSVIYLYLGASVLSIIFAHLGLKELSKEKGSLLGVKMVKFGFFVGYGIILLVLLIIAI